MDKFSFQEHLNYVSFLTLVTDLKKARYDRFREFPTEVVLKQ